MILRARLVRLAHAVPVIFLAMFGLVHLTPLVPWIARHLAVWDPEPRRGVIVVLGAEQQSDGTIGLMSYWRCVYAARLWKEGEFSTVLVSGGASNYLEPETPPSAPLADVMRDFLASLGVPKESIVVERTSTSTRSNAELSAPILKALPGPYTLVTSDFHSFRAQRCFRRLGVEIGSWPAPDVLKRANTWTYRLHCAMLLAEEGTKIAYYRWKGWI